MSCLANTHSSDTGPCAGGECVHNISALRDAIRNEGPHPRFHRQMLEQLQEEWPTLWRAIQAIIGLGLATNDVCRCNVSFPCDMHSGMR